MQFVLAARLKWTERPYGLDIVYGFHRAMGTFAGLLLLAHPILLAGGRPHHWSLLYSLSERWYIWVGRGALLALVVLAAMAVFRGALKLDYQKWQASHSALSFLLLAGAFVHVWNAGGDSKLTAMKALWLLLGGTALAAFLWHRLRVPARLGRHPYVVTEVRQEAKDVYTISIAPQTGAPPEYLPGQYQYLTLCPEGAAREEHPFTLSSSPTQTGHLSSTIKASGDWTAAIGRTRPGDVALVDAPFGRFSHLLHPGEGRLVFIAGGIGITPLLSMLRYMRDTGAGRDVLLLHANQTEGDIAFREELDAMENGEAPHLTVTHFLSKPPEGWKGEAGHLTEETLRRLVPDGADRAFYLCGPPKLLDALTAALQNMGVPDERIHFEQFSR